MKCVVCPKPTRESLYFCGDGCQKKWYAERSMPPLGDRHRESTGELVDEERNAKES